MGNSAEASGDIASTSQIDLTRSACGVWIETVEGNPPRVSVFTRFTERDNVFDKQRTDRMTHET